MLLISWQISVTLEFDLEGHDRERNHPKEEEWAQQRNTGGHSRETQAGTAHYDGAKTQLSRKGGHSPVETDTS